MESSHSSNPNRPAGPGRTELPICLLISITLVGVRAFYTHVVVVPYTMDEHLKGMHRLREPQPLVVHW